MRILDERTLLLPERPGNRIADTLTNLLYDPRIALLFLIPGVTEMFRVNGTSVITDDRALLEPCAVEERVPKLGLLITVQEAYTHCSKAALRSELCLAAQASTSRRRWVARSRTNPRTASR